jgi:hypothetical protein
MEFIFVFLGSCLVGIGTLLYYFISVWTMPPGYVYIGATHYWADYLFYVSQFIQGAHGRIVETNLYTENQTISIMAHWSNVMFGAIGHAIGLNPITSYHWAVFVLIVGIGIGAYVLFRNIFPNRSLAFPAFIFFIFSTSLMNYLPNTAPAAHWPFELWNTPHYIFSRFAPIPHTLMQVFLVITLLFVLFSKTKKTHIKRIVAACLFFLLMLIQPVVGLSILGTYWITVGAWKANQDKITPLVLTIIAGAVTLWTKQNVFSQESYQYVQLWEKSQQIRTNLPFLLASIGPIVPFATIGITFRIKKAEPIERFFLFLIIVSYLVFLSPIPEYLGICNARLLTGAYFVGIAWFAAVGATGVATIVSRVTWYKKSFALGIVMFLFILSVTPTIAFEIQHKMKRPDSVSDMMIYLPNSVHEAFQFLEQVKPYGDVVLANPMSFMDLRVPALSGHRTVNGTAFSPNEKTKRQETIDIFQKRMPANSVRTWFTNHRVRYILFTSYDGDGAAFQSTYPFLTPIFSNSAATVYQMSK